MFRYVSTLLLLSASLCAQTAPLMLGVLEDTPGTSPGDAHVRDVRAVFYKDGGAWKPFPTDCTDEACLQKLATDFQRETTWTVAYDGHRIGQVQSRIPLSIELNAHVGQQQIVSNGRVPTIGTRTEDYSGFLGEAVFRPLVVVSEPNFTDPDVWKPVTLDVSTTLLIRRAFRKKYPKITDCEAEEVRDYRDVDIHILKAYAAKTGWRLVLTSLKGCTIDDMRGTGLELEWFTIDPTGAVHYLAGNLVLVDAGDYDNSGHSQLLFMIDDYNGGGYTLYFDYFQKQATFEYAFH